MAGSTINSVSPHSQARVTQGVSSPVERNQPAQAAEKKQQALEFKDGFDPAKKQDPVALNPLDVASGQGSQGSRHWLSFKPTLPPGGDSFSALNTASGSGINRDLGLNRFNSAKPTLPPFEGGDDTFRMWSHDGTQDATAMARMPDPDASSKPTLPPTGPVDLLMSAPSGSGTRIGDGMRRPNSYKPTLPPGEGSDGQRATTAPTDSTERATAPQKGERGRFYRAQQQEQVRQLTFETLSRVRFSRIQG